MLSPSITTRLKGLFWRHCHICSATRPWPGEAEPVSPMATKRNGDCAAANAVTERNRMRNCMNQFKCNVSRTAVGLKIGDHKEARKGARNGQLSRLNREYQTIYDDHHARYRH